MEGERRERDRVKCAACCEEVDNHWRLDENYMMHNKCWGVGVEVTERNKGGGGGGGGEVENRGLLSPVLFLITLSQAGGGVEEFYTHTHVL